MSYVDRCVRRRPEKPRDIADHFAGIVEATASGLGILAQIAGSLPYVEEVTNAVLGSHPQEHHEDMSAIIQNQRQYSGAVHEARLERRRRASYEYSEITVL